MYRLGSSMKRFSFRRNKRAGGGVRVAAVGALLLCFASHSIAAPRLGEGYIVRFKAGAVAALSSTSVVPRKTKVRPERLSSRMTLKALKSALRARRVESLPKGWVFVQGSDRAGKLGKARRNGLVAKLEKNAVLKAAYSPNDFWYQQGEMWGFHNEGQFGGKVDVDIDAPEAWEDDFKGEQVVVAVIDSGLYYKHRDLDGRTWTNPKEIAGNRKDDDQNGLTDDVHGYDFINDDSDPVDDMYHGTHIAGIIGAIRDNEIGLPGITHGVKIMPLKILNERGEGDTVGAIKAIDYAVRRAREGVKVRVINASFGGTDYSAALREAIRLAEEQGILVVAAAGNYGSNIDEEPVYPASYPASNIITVGAVDMSGEMPGFSNYGTGSVHVAAPGVHIRSTSLYNLYTAREGTSMAAPHVAGVAALLFSKDPSLSPQEVRGRLMRSCKTLRALAQKVGCGGVISASHALKNTKGASLE